MKILNSYKKIAKEFIKEAAWDRKFGEPLPTLKDVMKEAEVDDDKIIKYKDKEGESQEMTAGAAKKQPDDHPAKQAYNKMAGDDDSGDEPKGKALGGSDFDRDFDDDEPKDEPSGDSMDNLYDELPGDNEETENLLNPGASEEEYKDAANTLNDRVKKAGHYKGVNAENLRDAVESGDISSEEAKEIYTYLADPSDENYNNMSDEANQAVMDNEILDSEGEIGSESITINGKQYRPIKESKEPTKSIIHSFKKTYKRIGGK